MPVLVGRSQAVDAMVRSAFESELNPVFPTTGIAVLAVGGYGRKELFPYSDIDILLLVASIDVAKPEKDAIARFLQSLWDSGLRLSQSVRTVEECTTLHENNIELNTSILDYRLICGDEPLYASLDKKMPDFLKHKGPLLAKHIAGLARARHSNFQGTIYHLEPDIKEAPGGLRDFHTVRWLSRLQAGDSASLEPELAAAFELLSSIRMGLHGWSKRDNNALSFEGQDVVAESGPRKSPEAPSLETQSPEAQSPEEMMRAYYRAARSVFHAVRDRMELSEGKDSGLLSQFRSWRSRLSTSEFTVSRECAVARSPQLLESDAGLVLRLFEFVGRHELRLAPDTQRRLGAFHPPSNQLNWQEVQALLKLPKVSAALRSMNESGVLSKLVPEWANIECLVVRDFYHRYTVDEHTIVTIETLEHLTDGRFQRLLEESGRIDLLRAALLFHDIGKGASHELGEDHEIRSKVIAENVLDRWGVEEKDRTAILFLIEHHLVLSTAMTKRDLADPATAIELANRVGTIENLKLLTLMTFGDISAVYPGAMTPWRLEQLWRTHILVNDELTRELDKVRIHAPANRRPHEAEFLEGLPVRYARTHSEAQIQAHIRLAQSAATPAGVAISLERIHGIWQAVIVTQDRPFLLASLAGGLAGFGMNIVKAEAFANAASMVVDTFAFEDPHRTLELNPEEVDRLRKTLSQVATGKQDVRKLLSGRRPAAPKRTRIAPTVLLKNDAVPGTTLLEIVAEDRPGLLYDLASAISRAGCDIEVVLIDTEAHRALDVFYLKYGGGRIPEDLHASIKAELTEACSPAQL